MELYSTVLWHLRREVDLSHLAQSALALDRLDPRAWCIMGNCFSLQKVSRNSLSTPILSHPHHLSPTKYHIHYSCCLPSPASFAWQLGSAAMPSETDCLKQYDSNGGPFPLLFSPSVILPLFYGRAINTLSPSIYDSVNCIPPFHDCTHEWL